MPKAVDITGQKFGRLTAIRESHKDDKHHYWIFKCDCSKLVTAQYDNVVYGRTKSCGCISKEKRDISGQKFGRLTAIKRVGTYLKGKAAIWLFKCDCGKLHTATRRQAKSCGCLATEKRRLQADKLRELNTKYTTEERRKVRTERARREEKSARESLSDRYIKKIIYTKLSLKSAQIPQETLEAYRKLIQAHRRIRDGRLATDNTEN